MAADGVVLSGAREQVFPIQRERGAKAHRLLIPWSVAEKAYAVYSAQHGTSQSLQRLADRGGFAPSEMDAFHPTWREEANEITELRAALQQARQDLTDEQASHRCTIDSERHCGRVLVDLCRIVGMPANSSLHVEVAKLVTERPQLQQARLERDELDSEYASFREHHAATERMAESFKSQLAALDAALQALEREYRLRTALFRGRELEIAEWYVDKLASVRAARREGE